MFDNLSDRLSGALKNLKGEATLSEENIQGTLSDVRMALLEADVALPVVKDFIESIKQRALGKEVQASLSPGQAFLKIVQAELQAVMGDANEGLDLSAQPPAVVLMAG
ncbi:MAG: signal recognition particle receptor subunit alpha, partial [Methylococcales bacterium]